MTDFIYDQPVKIYFGNGKSQDINSILAENGCKKAVLVCNDFFIDKCDEFKKQNDMIVACFADVRPNPLLSGAEEVVRLIHETGADTVIGYGGGSAMDTAKFAAACAFSELSPLEQYKEQRFPEKIATIVAIPTTAGTGSEVTKVSVISHGEEKKSIHNPVFAPKIAIVDPELTLTVPPKTVMMTGLDALTHAIEAYWSKNHQPITDILAVESIKIILANLENSYLNGDLESRTNMSYAALLAGMAFALPKTAACHACSFPLSSHYHLPHGEACALTLDSLIMINNSERFEEMSKKVGLSSSKELAEKVLHLKKVGGLCTSLSSIEGADIDMLARESEVHPLMQNNPVKLDYSVLKDMFTKLL